MTKDYEEARDRVSSSALKVLREYGADRAIEMYRGGIDALTVAIFAATGPGGRESIGLALDNTKTNHDGGLAA